MTGLPSEIAGTAGLWVLLALAAGVAWVRRGRVAEGASLKRTALVALALQLGHSAEELTTGFPHRFPAMLGLSPWTPTFFILFNLCWLALWAGSIATIRSGRMAFLPLAALWFLAFAAVANFVAHPALALAAGGYFPGLVTAIPLGIAGLALICRLSGARF